jgi:outer membrane protein OmpA-like peptidoglycan-associated protein
MGRICLLGFLCLVGGCLSFDRAPTPKDTVIQEFDDSDGHFLPSTKFVAHGFDARRTEYDYTGADVVESVHFAFDDAKITPAERARIGGFAKIFARGNAPQILAVGHCDRFGTEQYNYTLGQRRAEAVRGALIAAGIDGGSVITASLGSSRARKDAASREDGAADRRCDIVVRGK